MARHNHFRLSDAELPVVVTFTCVTADPGQCGNPRDWLVPPKAKRQQDSLGTKAGAKATEPPGRGYWPVADPPSAAPRRAAPTTAVH